MYIRKAAFAGAFYDEKEIDLKKSVEEFINGGSPVIDQENIVGIVSPHAGYIYSGHIAGVSYAQLSGMDIDTVVILATSHKKYFDGASVIKDGMYETPLGQVEIDDEFSKKLLVNEYVNFMQEVHEEEHSLEVQIPFVQETFKDARIVPIIIGSSDLTLCESLADCIYSIIKNSDKKIMMVVSTDLSHFHSEFEAHNIDKKFIDIFKTFNTTQLYSSVASKESEACGIAPVLTGMFLSKMLGAKEIEILKYATSADTSGNISSVVGYLSAAFTK